MEDRLSEWFTSYRDALVRDLVSRFRTLSTDDALDLVQDVFLQIRKKAPRVREQSAWTYLRTAVRRRALNHFRTLEARRRHETAAPHPHVPPAADVALIRREATARVRAAIRNLPDLTRRCVLLRLRGTHGAEIARATRLSEVAVRSRLYDARQRLRASGGGDS
ncbi:MAG TPA: RNA polymerase sigma factor [Thermoanaerobaculia bacterium]|nr:RNA polymerase sigma factor [Thermoanaerobaculia bacterium]